MDLEDQYDKLYRYCYFRVRDVQTAEDLVQETFLRWLDHYPCLLYTSDAADD